MLDPHLLRTDLDSIVARLAERGYAFPKESYIELETQRKALQTESEQLRAERNTHSKSIGVRKSQGEDCTDLLKDMARIGERLKHAQAEFELTQSKLQEILQAVPNLPHSNVAVGASEAENKEIDRWGDVPSFKHQPLDHVALGEHLQQLNFAAAAKLTGARFVVIEDAFARLHRSLINMMLNVHTQKHGYREMNVPYLVNADSMFGTGQFPKMKEDAFHCADDDYYLIPTAEVPLTNLYRDSIVDASDLPIKLVAHTPCFRREAGAYGQDTRGMIRQHQFEKVELVQLVQAQESFERLEELTQHAENILRKLDLAYRKVALCTGDLGFASAKTYDLEVWLPSQDTYREISSCSNFVDFQARRMHARMRQAQSKPQLLHTLNGSGLAIGRTLVAIVENYQNADGSITVPEVLRHELGDRID